MDSTGGHNIASINANVAAAATLSRFKPSIVGGAMSRSPASYTGTMVGTLRMYFSSIDGNPLIGTSTSRPAPGADARSVIVARVAVIHVSRLSCHNTAIKRHRATALADVAADSRSIASTIRNIQATRVRTLHHRERIIRFDRSSVLEHRIIRYSAILWSYMFPRSGLVEHRIIYAKKRSFPAADTRYRLLRLGRLSVRNLVRVLQSIIAPIG